MGRLFKAFFFKLTRDLTFRIVLIIGAGIAFFMTALYLMIDLGVEGLAGDTDVKFLTGPNMLLTSFNPTSNFGLAIPICLITFTCLEFTQGTIRNKIPNLYRFSFKWFSFNFCLITCLLWSLHINRYGFRRL